VRKDLSKQSQTNRIRSELRIANFTSSHFKCLPLNHDAHCAGPSSGKAAQTTGSPSGIAAGQRGAEIRKDIRYRSGTAPCLRRARTGTARCQ
jgi:hypothetical protein